MQRFLCLTALAVAFALSPAAHRALANNHIRTIAYVGFPVPGLPDESLTSFSFEPALNNAGTVAFSANTTFSASPGPPSLTGRLLTYGPNGMRTAAIAGTQSPGAEPGTLLGGHGNININDLGQTLHTTALFGPQDPFSRRALLSEQANVLGIVARTNRQAPGTADGDVYAFTSFVSDGLAINRSGSIAFSSAISSPGPPPSFTRGIWVGDANDAVLVARVGEQAPGLPDGVTFSDLSVFGLPMTDAGRTFFSAEVVGPGIDAGNEGGIWSSDGSSTTLLLRSGSQVPETAAGTVFLGFSRVSGNSEGAITFTSTLAGPGVNEANDLGLFAGQPDTLQVRARTGEQAPGTPQGTQFSFFNPPVLNASGRTAFTASLEGDGVDETNQRGLWSEGFGELRLVARRGDPAPGVADSSAFESLVQFVLNSQGQTAFWSTLGGASVDSTNDSGIWAQDTAGSLHLIVREGDLLEVEPGVTRTVASLGFVGGSGNDDGLASTFNNLGQLAFHASFTDGTDGIFISDLVAIPEPCGASLLLLGACLFAKGARA